MQYIDDEGFWREGSEVLVKIWFKNIIKPQHFCQSMLLFWKSEPCDNNIRVKELTRMRLNRHDCNGTYRTCNLFGLLEQ